MAKIFVDVGAHIGETLAVAMEERWGFDRIYSFEPAPQCWPALEAMADDRVEILRFGLWTEDSRLLLHDPGLVGASLVEDKRLTGSTAEVEVRDGAAWFAGRFSPDDEVVVKINCEGAECDLLDHLLAADALGAVDEMLVHFDVRKIPSRRHQEQATRARLDAAGVPYRASERIFFGRNITEKTTNWLAWYHASPVGRIRYAVLKRFEFAARRGLWALRQRLRR